MKFERIRSVDYYCCPACGMAFTDRKEAERHFRYDHQIEICKVIRCNICGTGWDAKVYGEQEARRRSDSGTIIFCFKWSYWICKKSTEGGCEEE